MILFALVCSGCSAGEPREVSGGYCLDRMFGGDHYNLTGCWTHPFKLRGRTDNGPMDGTIARLGWDQRYILAWRKAVFGNERDGWMLLDTRADRLDPILTDAALESVCSDLQNCGIWSCVT